MENITEKIKKLRELVERGIDGEADNAKNLLNAIIEKYGLKIDEIDEENYYSSYHKNKSKRTLILQIIAVIRNTQKVESFSKTNDRRHIFFKLTQSQYIDAQEMIDWHLNQMRKEFNEMKRLFAVSYISKHHLYPDIDKGDAPPSEDSDKIMAIADAMSNEKYYKQLGFNKMIE